MKAGLTRVNVFFRGVGSVVLISLAGLAILLFAGILPAHKELDGIRNETDNLIKKWEAAENMKPMVASTQLRIENETTLLDNAVLPAPFPNGELAQLSNQFLEVLETTDLSEVNARWRLGSEDDNEVLLSVSAKADYRALPAFFGQLNQWPHWNGLAAMAITADGPELDLRFTLRIPLSP